ncbi:MAG: TetR/AcrR family transcriptional regulator [Janthinobacterium lividum]
MSTIVPDRPLRADAARNRGLVIDAARQLFAERGLEVTLHDVAEAAGVGVGTVYRRFPDKEALLGALVEAKYVGLIELAQRCAQLVDSREALRTYLLGALELRAGDKALSDVVMRAAPATAGVLLQRADLGAAVDSLIERARTDGVVREGFGTADVPVFSTMLGAVADRVRGGDPSAWRRYAVLLVDAVCPPEDDEGAALLGSPARLPLPGR